MPIVIACDRCSEATRIAGYQSGVDDYLHGRMSPREVRERLLAIVRRIKRPPVPDLNTYIGRHLIADFERVSISVDSSAVELTRREFDLLRVLVEHRNEILTRQELLDAVWYAVSVNDHRTVDVHIRRLRAKIGVAARQIDTLPGRGYRFSEESPADAGERPVGDVPDART